MTFSLSGRIGINTSELQRAARNAKKDVTDLADVLDEVDGTTVDPTVTIDDKASGELGTIRRDVTDLDGERSTPVVDIDDRASASIDDIEDKLENDLGDAGEAGGEAAASGIGAALGDFAAAGAAGAGAAVGAALVAGLNEAMDRVEVRAKIQQQFDLTAADAARYSEEAGDIYADGWGDSAELVLESLALIDQRLVRTGQVAADETAAIAESAQTVADVFDKDVGEVIDAVSRLLINGLAPNAESALDTIASGMQNGADFAGDLFESIEEYSQQFGAMGISAAEMMELFATGAQNGLRDTDKLADAVKEFRIRAVEDSDAVGKAYSDLGLDADTYRNKILEGGPAAREAFGDVIDAIAGVEDPLEQNEIMLALMATQFEDLGPAALDTFQSISEAVEDTTGTVEGINTELENAQSATDKLKRKFTEVKNDVFDNLNKNLAEMGGLLTDVKDALPIPELGEANDELSVMDSTLNQLGLGIFAEQNDDYALSNRDLAGSFTALTEAQREEIAERERYMGTAGPAVAAADDYVASLEKLGAEVDANGTAAAALAEHTAEVEAADQAAEEAAEDRAEALADLGEKMDDLIGKQTDLVGSELKVQEAQIKAREAAAEYQLALDGVNAEGEEVKLSEDEMAQATIDATEAQIAAAEAAADLEVAQREANGEVVSAQDANKILADEYRNVAGTLAADSPLRSRLLDYANDLDQIPGDVTTDVVADTDDAISRVDAIIAKYDAIPASKTTIVNTINRVDGANGFRAKGGPVLADNTYWVGEEGPELVTFGHNAFVHDAQTSQTMAAQSEFSMAAAGSAMSVPVSSAPMMSGGGSAGVLTPNVEVQVRIGERDITDIVSVVVMEHDQQEAMTR